MIKSFKQLKDATRDRIGAKSSPKVGLILPAGERCTKAVTVVSNENWIKPVLFGTKDEIQGSISLFADNISDIESVEVDNTDAAIKESSGMIKAGELDFLMPADIIDKTFIDRLCSVEAGFIKNRGMLSHVALLQVEQYHKLMFLTDALVNNKLEVLDKIRVTQNAAEVASRLGIEPPRAALLAAVEAIYPAVPVTMEEAAIAKMSDRGLITWGIIDGPLSFDVAIDSNVAWSKGVTDSKVAGDADIFVAPSIETANGVYKALVIFAGAESAGILYGGPSPVVTMLAVDSTESIINSIILAAYLSLG
jgi:phosphotransacetylase